MTKLRLIQCGVGGHGKSWLSITPKHDDFDLVAVVDISPATLAATELPLEKRFATLEEALKKVQADAVLTVTPPPVHLQHAKLAFERGLHLMTEKPIADSMGNAKRMVELAAEAGRQLFVAQNYRYFPGAMKLRQILKDQPLGFLGHGHIDFYIAGDFTGTFRQTMEFPLLVDMAIHHLDLLRAITGKNILRVTAHTFNPPWSWFQHHAGLKMLLELEDGLVFSYSGDWSAKGKQTPWGGAWRLQCPQGSIHWEGDHLSIGRGELWGQNQSMEQVEISPLSATGQAMMLSDFAAAIHSGVPAETSGQDNLQSFAAVMAGVLSAEERRPVNVSDLLGW